MKPKRQRTEMKCRPNIKLGFCRIISGGAWQQLGVAFAIFLAVLLVVVCLYWVVPEQVGAAAVRTEESIGTRAAMAFSDMISPVSFRDEAYLSPSRGIQPLWLLMLAYLAGVIVLSGVLIATITNILGTQADRFRNGIDLRSNIIKLSFCIFINSRDNDGRGIFKYKANFSFEEK